MGFFFDKKDSLETIINNLGGKHTPDSVKKEAEMELRGRGFGDFYIKAFRDHSERNE